MSGQTPLLWVVVLTYLTVGVGVAWRLAGRHGWGPAAGALLAWPVFLPLLTDRADHSGGPHAARIAAAFAALEHTLEDPAAGDVPWDADLSGLRSALCRTDERLGLVERLLADAEGARTETLIAARDRTRSEIEAVLDEVVQLRLQIGLAALAGNAASVRERLSELLSRAEALDEVATLDG